MPSIDVGPSLSGRSLSSGSASPTATRLVSAPPSADWREAAGMSSTTTVSRRKRSSFRASWLGSTGEGSPDSVNNSERSFDAGDSIPSPGLPQPDYDLSVNSLGISSSRQKKFLRLFHEVSPDERLLNFYSCALAGDLLLQGHLYVTKNHFAFYSKVFGYVTKLLIPVSDVRRISKEKTVKLFPNAVGISTHSEKHVLTSLLSRDATYRLLTNVWRVYHYPNGLIPLSPADVDREMDGSSINDDHSSNDSLSQRVFITNGQRSRSEGSRSDDEDSAIERSQTPSPAREDALQPELHSTPSHNSKFSFDFHSSQDVDEVDGSTVTKSEEKSRWLIHLMMFLVVVSLIISVSMYYRVYRLQSNLDSRIVTNEELSSVQSHLFKVRQILDSMEPLALKNNHENLAKENSR